MVDAESEYCRSLVNIDSYPIDRLDDVSRAEVIGEVRERLGVDGCAVLPGFLSGAGCDVLLTEAEQRRPSAYFSAHTDANVYFSADVPRLHADHPRRVFMKRTNGFITADNYGPESASKRLYDWPPLTRFIADCLAKSTLFIYDDPVSNMIVNVGRPGTQFTWHFDTNEFTVTMLLKAAKDGGRFEYAPNLRTSEDECYDDVKAVLEGSRERVVSLDLRPGDLQLFLGRFSLHRVTENTGDTDRLLLIMSFADRPGMIGSVHRTRTLYGKVTDVHRRAERERVRSDTLED